jgi:hypothetical protein
VKKTIGIAVALVVVLAVLRRFGPALRDRAMAKCQDMFESHSMRERTLDEERDKPVSATAGAAA